MRSGSLVEESYTIARQCIFLTLLGASIIIACLLLERTIFQTENEKATKQLVSSHIYTNKILLTDETLTLSATMAAITGKDQWIQHYNKNLPIIDQAIKQTLDLAPTDIAKDFDNETRLSNDKLVKLEETAFDSLKAGNTTKALNILQSPTYISHKKILKKGTSKFIDDMVRAKQSNLSHIQKRAKLLQMFLLFGAVLSGYLLFRRLNTSLNKTETAYLEAESEIRFLANNDPLTGLANRASFQDALKTAFSRAELNNSELAILMLDLDCFKPVNDLHGHPCGDFVLKKVAQRINKVLKNHMMCARYGGDEFIIYIEFNKNDNTPNIISREIIETLSKEIIFDDISVKIGASIGIAEYPKHASNSLELIRKADLALYSAKENGRNRYQLYQQEMEINLDKRTLQEEELRKAISNNHIVPFFQPIICLDTGRIKGFEILSRWLHPQQGIISPIQFIPLAETTGIIGELTLSVLQQACEQALSFPDDSFIALNIAPRDIQDEWLVEKILNVLQKTGFPAHRLEVELTENALINDLSAARRVISSLKNLGVKIALDDFGTGYSSLYYLSELSFDKLKIDRSFISSLHDREESKKIIHAIINLGQSFDIPIVAEGIEQENDAQVLGEMGCHMGQGFLYSKPIQAEEIPQLIEKLAPMDSQAISA